MTRERNTAPLTRSEDELVVQTRPTETSLRARQRVESERVQDEIPRRVQEAEVERVPAAEGDSGEVETLPDGSISIPLLEEELVITKRTVVRERIVIHRRTVTEVERIDTELRSERLDLEVEGDKALVRDERES